MGWVAFYQIFAILLGLPWRYPKQSDVPPPARRSVELRRWSITDFVSPALIMLGFASILSVYVANAYWYVYGGSDFALDEAEVARFFVARVTTLIVASVLLAWTIHRIVWPVSPVSKDRMNDIWLPVRNDPYLSDSDRLRQRQQFLRWQFVGVTVIGLFLLCYLFRTARILVLDPVWFRLAVSIGWQALFLLAPIHEFKRIRSHDFSVYRAA